MTLFQSHNGAIAAERRNRTAPQHEGFQSHNGAIAAFNKRPRVNYDIYVSIPQWCDCCTLSKSLSFRDDDVSIPQWCDCCVCSNTKSSDGNSSFNPTMVRLLPKLTLSFARAICLFQSHNGAIAAVKLTKQLPQASLFQSHNGAIAASIKAAADAMTDLVFQSHNGAIAALTMSVAS